MRSSQTSGSSDDEILGEIEKPNAPTKKPALIMENKIVATPDEIVGNIAGAIPRAIRNVAVSDIPEADEVRNEELLMKEAEEIVKKDNERFKGTYFGVEYKTAPRKFISEKENLRLKVPAYFINCAPHLIIDKSAPRGYRMTDRCTVGGYFIEFKNHKYSTDNRYEIEYLLSDACRKTYRIISVEA